MATFSSSIIGSRYPKLNTNHTRSSLFGEKLVYSICFPDRTTRPAAALKVEGVGGGVRFKGTQMREKKLTEMIENKVTEAKEVCAGDESSDECKVAWDEVEEVSQAKAHLRVKLEHKEDPLEPFCSENPETDECSVYY